MSMNADIVHALVSVHVLQLQKGVCCGHQPSTHLSSTNMSPMQMLEAQAAVHAEATAGAHASHAVQLEDVQQQALAQLTDLRHLHEREMAMMQAEHAETLQRAQASVAGMF